MLRECYQIVTDPIELEKFINFLPQTSGGEQYYVSLFTRKKYDTSGLLKCDKNCIKRFTAKKEHLISKLYQLECPVGAYTYDGKPVPQECLAVYITPNPRSLWKSGLQMLKRIADKVGDGNENYNPKSLALDVLQVTPARKIYFDIDIDFLEEKNFAIFISMISLFINPDCIQFVQTRGGFHALVKLNEIKEQFKNTWHKGFTQITFNDVGIMMNSDGLLPIPGCFQGGFTPRLL